MIIGVISRSSVVGFFRSFSEYFSLGSLEFSRRHINLRINSALIRFRCTNNLYRAHESSSVFCWYIKITFTVYQQAAIDSLLSV